jgi:hypothetical protein
MRNKRKEKKYTNQYFFLVEEKVRSLSTSGLSFAVYFVDGQLFCFLQSKLVRPERAVWIGI